MAAKRILFPREHGAWALLAGAFLVAWSHPWARGPGPLLLALVFLFAFAAQAPLREIVAGRGGAAWGWLLGYGLALATCGVLLVLGHGAWLLLPAAIFAVLFTAVDLLARRRKLHRSVGHRVVGAASISLLLPGMLSLFHPEYASYSFVLWGLVLAYFLTRMPLVRAHQSARQAGGGESGSHASIIASQAMLVLLVTIGIALGWFAPWIGLALVPGLLSALAPVRGLPIPVVGKREILHLLWFLTWIVVSFHLGGFDPLL